MVVDNVKGTYVSVVWCVIPQHWPQGAQLGMNPGNISPTQ